MAAAHLRAHVKGRTALGVCELARHVHYLTDPKVAKLDVAARREEDVRRLEIAVQQLALVVAVRKRIHKLTHDRQDLRFAEPCTALLSSCCDGRRKVSSCRMLHDDMQLLAVDK